MKKIIIGLLIIAAVIFLVTRNNSQNTDTLEVTSEIMSQDGMDNGENMMETEPQVNMMEDTSTAGTTDLSSGYEAYMSSKLAFANEGNVVIFFRASWCPSCRALDEDIKASLGDIPNNLLILDANYDTENEMKQKYGVTTQHTLVQVDAEGNMIQKWAGGSTLESIIEKL